MPAIRQLRTFLILLLLLLPDTARAQFGSAIQGTVTDSQQALVPEATVRVTNTTTGVTREAVTSGGRRLPRDQPGTWGVSRRSRQIGIRQGPARRGHARDQRDDPPGLRAGAVRRRRDGDRRQQGAPRRNRAGARVGPRRPASTAGDAAQRQESVQPARAPARRHRQRLLRLDQRRRRRGRFVRRRVRAPHQRQRAAGRGELLHR